MRKQLFLIACLLGSYTPFQAIAQTFPEEGKYYRITAQSGNNPVLSVSPENNYILKGVATTATITPYQIWSFKADPDDAKTYAMLCNGRYVNEIPLAANNQHNINYSPKTTDVETFYINLDSKTVTMNEVSVSGYSIYFDKTPGSGTNGHCICNNGNSINNWGPNTQPAVWAIEEATEIPLTIGATGYASINFGFPVELEAGMKAYTICNETATAFELEEIGSVIPANTPVILTGEQGSHTLAILSDAAAAEKTNSVNSNMEGTLFPKAVTPGDGETIYCLAANDADGTACFRKLNPNDNEIAANKAYYRSTCTYVAETKGFGTATGISAGQLAQPSATAYYDLNGKRVLYPTTGIYVTAEGKKLLIK